ncbi:hypothetical protein ACU4GR_17585 [Methylobacterium oryzae CBMB20]
MTNRRVVLQAGIALPVTHNLPFAQIESAALRAFTDGSGDLPLRLRPGLRIAYLQHLAACPALASRPDRAHAALRTGRGRRRRRCWHAPSRPMPTAPRRRFG